MENLTLQEMLEDLSCCSCYKSSLSLGVNLAEELACGSCRRRYPCEGSIPNFLLDERLDDTNRNEIAGNQIDHSDQTSVSHLASKDEWDPAYTRTLMYAINVVADFIKNYSEETVLISLGSGTGFELKKLCELRSFRRVYSSDISMTATQVVPMTLSTLEGKIGLFVAEFSHAPVIKREGVLGLVFQALHHTTDAHVSLRSLLENTFLDLVIVEPTTNWFIEILAYVGIAKREEYSGLKPSWLNLSAVRAIAEQCGYRIRIRTWWEFPPQLRSLFDRTPTLSRFVQTAVEGFSWITSCFNFGSMSAIHFTKI